MKRSFVQSPVFLVFLMLGLFWNQPVGFAEDQVSVTIDSPSNQEKVSGDFDVKAHVHADPSVKKVAVVLYDDKDQVIASAATQPTVGQKLTVEILSPKDNQEISGIVHVVAKTNSDKGFDKIRIAPACGNDGQPEFKAGQPYEMDWDTTACPNHWYYLRVYALNNPDTAVESTSIKVTVNNQQGGGAQGQPSPEVSIVSPSDGDTVKGMVPIELKTSGDVDQIEIALPDGATAYPMKNKLPYAWNWDSTDVSDGSYPITAKVTDKLGASKQARITVTVQNNG